MKDIVTKAMEWVNLMFREPYIKEIQDYLCQATDHADLERRIRMIERRGLL